MAFPDGVGVVSEFHRGVKSTYVAGFAQLRERLSGDEDEVRAAFENLRGLGKDPRHRRAQAAQVADSCFDQILAGLRSDGGTPSSRSVAPVQRTLNLPQADVAKFVSLLVEAEVLDLGPNVFTQAELRRYWDTEPQMHDDLVRYFLRPEMVLRSVQDWVSWIFNEMDLTGSLAGVMFEAVARSFELIGSDPVRSVVSALSASLPRNQNCVILLNEIYAREQVWFTVALKRIAERIDPELARRANFEPLAGALQMGLHGGYLIAAASPIGDARVSRNAAAFLRLTIGGFLSALA